MVLTSAVFCTTYLLRFAFTTQMIRFQAPKTQLSFLDSTKPTLHGQVLKLFAFVYPMFTLADCTLTVGGTI